MLHIFRSKLRIFQRLELTEISFYQKDDPETDEKTKFTIKYNYFIMEIEKNKSKYPTLEKYMQTEKRKDHFRVVRNHKRWMESEEDTNTPE